MYIGENSLIENLQVFACILAFLILFFGSIAQRNILTKQYVSMSIFLSIIPYLGAARELSFGRTLGLSDAATSHSKTILAIILLLLLAACIALLISSIFNRSFQFSIFFQGYRFLFLSVFLIALAQCFEKGQFGLPVNQTIEEFCELLGYISLCALAASRFKKAII